MNKFIYVIFLLILFQYMCFGQIAQDITKDPEHPQFLVFGEEIPINVTFYKDPNLNKIQVSLEYKCEIFYFRGIELRANCSLESTYESKYIWGSDLRTCVNYTDPKNGTRYIRCNYVSDESYFGIFKPYNVQLLKLPSTRGGKVNITGNYMRSGIEDIKRMWLITYERYVRPIDVAGDYFDPNYNPNNLLVDFIPGCGVRTLCFDSYKRKCITMKYQSPSIKSSFYNQTSQQVTIIGDNFFNVTSVASFKLNNITINKSDIVLYDHEIIILSYISTHSQSLNINIDIDSLSTSGSVKIEPLPISYSTNVTKYNDGIIEIKGTHFTSLNEINNISVVIDNNYNCNILFYNNTFIQCKLSSQLGDNKQHLLNICINDICNSNKFIFEYGKPKFNEIDSFSQDSSIFTFYGQCFGSLIDNSTKLLLKYNNNNDKLTLLPLFISNNETVLSFDIPFFCGISSVQLIVNGIESNLITISGKPLLKVIQSPSTDSKQSLNVLLSYYDCKYYNNNNSNPIIKSSQIKGNKVNNTLYSFIVNQGTGYKSEIITFANQDTSFEYFYAKPVVLNHSINIDNLNNQNIITINGNNYGLNSSLCNITYNGIVKKCQVNNHYQIVFNVSKLEISSNIIITIDGIVSDNYKLELVNCILINDNKFPTSFGCLNSNPAIHYNCEGLKTFNSKLNNQLLKATLNNQSININIQNDNVTIPIPEGSITSTLNLYLNGLLSKSYEVKRNESIIYQSKLKYDKKNNIININFNGMNFGTPFIIQFPTLFNSSIDLNNCSLLYHGTSKNEDCNSDIIDCKIQLQNEFNNTLLLDNTDNHEGTENKTSNSIPFIFIMGSTTIKSNITNIEHTEIQDNNDDNNNKTKIVLAVVLPIGIVALIGAGIFAAFKYHQNKINNSKNKNIDNEKK